MNYAVYRILYGEDFIQESIRSIDQHIDKIFVFWTNKVLGRCAEVTYRENIIKFPDKIDGVLDKIRELNSNKIILIEDYVENNINQFTHLVNDLILPNYERPNAILFMEPDHVWRSDQITGAFKEFDSLGATHATVSQIELWKEPKYRIPPRKRISSVFWNLDKVEIIPPTRRQADTSNIRFMSSYVHNLGFCVSKRTMYWKHLTAIAFSKKIGDSPPNEDWLEKTWAVWDFNTNNKNLEISKGYEHMIPAAQTYNIDELPELIKERYYT